MIRYSAPTLLLKGKIRALNSTWLTDARRRTARFRHNRSYSEKNPTWSLVKPVYIAIQHKKCAYCERTLESGKIEWDIEHYRPKKAVEEWPDPASGPKAAYTFSTGRRSTKGYYLLAYQLGNFIVSCKVCNTSHKRNYFPIGAAKRTLSVVDPRLLLREKPFVPYPLGTLDDDPETLLTFRGFLCVPAFDRGHKRNRALVTIGLLGLNGRDALVEQRAELIVSTWVMLERRRTSPNDTLANNWIQRVTSDRSKHANCARSFVAEYYRNRALAKTYMREADQYLESK